MLVRVMLALALACACCAQAQDYPSRPVRLVIPNAPGGGSTVLAHLLGDRFKERYGQPLIVENRAGAGGNIGAEAVYRSAPDGHTLLFTTPGPAVINKALYARMTFDPDALVAVSLVAMSPNLIIANPKVPAENLQQLIGYAKANPGRLTYATAGAGSAGHLTMELLKSLAGIDIVHVPYKGIVPARTDVVAGQADIMFAELGGALPLIQSGKLRALAMGSERRNPALPEVASLSEVIPGLVYVAWYGMFAPPGTPPAIASDLAGFIAQSLRQPEVVQRVQSLSLEPVGSTPAEMEQFLRKEREHWSRAVRVSGAKAD